MLTTTSNDTPAPFGAPAAGAAMSRAQKRIALEVVDLYAWSRGAVIDPVNWAKRFRPDADPGGRTPGDWVHSSASRVWQRLTQQLVEHGYPVKRVEIETLSKNLGGCGRLGLVVTEECHQRANRLLDAEAFRAVWWTRYLALRTRDRATRDRLLKASLTARKQYSA